MATGSTSNGAGKYDPFDDFNISASEEGGTYGVNGNQSNGIPPASSHARGSYMEDITIPLNNVPAWTPKRKLKIAIIGAGYSGLIMAHKLMYERKAETEKLLDFVIYEAKDVPGGTWVDNTYPGGNAKLLYVLSLY